MLALREAIRSAGWRMSLAISWSEIMGEEGTLLMLSNMRHAELCPVSSRGIRLEAKFCTNRKWEPNNLTQVNRRMLWFSKV